MCDVITQKWPPVSGGFFYVDLLGRMPEAPDIFWPLVASFMLGFMASGPALYFLE